MFQKILVPLDGSQLAESAHDSTASLLIVRPPSDDLVAHDLRDQV